MLELRNDADGPAIYIYGSIGDKYDGYTDAELAQVIGNIDADAPLQLHINSPGGDYWQGIGMYNLLQARAGQITVQIDGMAASAASIVAMAGDVVQMATGSSLMIHETHLLTAGTADDFEKAAKLMRDKNEELLAIYNTRWKGGKRELRAALAAETWYSTPDAIEAGFADEAITRPALAAHYDKSKFHHQHEAPQPDPRLQEARATLSSLQSYL